MKKGMIAEVIFLGIFFVLIAGIASAEHFCRFENQTIMRLYQATNSHVSLTGVSGICQADPATYCQGSYTYCSDFVGPPAPGSTYAPKGCVGGNPPCDYTGGGLCLNYLNQASCQADTKCLWQDLGAQTYNYSVCFDEIFGYNYTGANPNECTGTNKILGLYQGVNSHAEVPGLSGYEVNLCYGSLSCTSVSEPALCPSGFNAVARLYQQSNSHISFATDGDYPIKICCSSTLAAASANLTRAYWSKNTACQGENVQLTVVGTNLSGKQINYTIYKKSDNQIVMSQISLATSNDANSIAWSTSEEGEYYFNASIIGSAAEKSTLNNSGAERYVKFEDACTVVPGYQIAIVSSPIDKMIYFLDEELNFQFRIGANIGTTMTNWTWDLGDGTILKGDNSNLANKDFRYAYTTTGQKNVKINVTYGNGYVGYAQASILIINSTFILSHIYEPIYGAFYPNEVFGDTRVFGGDSYAIDAIWNAATGENITCTMGGCPINSNNELKTEGHLARQGGYQIPINGISFSHQSAGYENVIYNWSFSDDNWATELAPYTQVGRAQDTSYIPDFQRRFAVDGLHKAKLTTIFNGMSSEVENIFITGKGGYCSSDGKAWYDGIYSYPPKPYNTLNTTACGDFSGASRCCPRGYSCQSYGSSKKCQAVSGTCIDNNINSCSKYITNASCANDICNVGNSAGYDWNLPANGYAKCGAEKTISGVGWQTLCKGCYWDAGDSGGKCKFQRTYRQSIYNPNDNEEYTCLRETTSEEAGDQLIISWTEDSVMLQGGTIIDLLQYPDARAQYPECQSGSSSQEMIGTQILPFFTEASLAAAILIIIIFYIITLRNKKRFSAKKKK